MAKFVYKIPAHQWQTINHNNFKRNAVDCRSRLTTENTLKVEEKVHYFENKCNFSSPLKNAWGTCRDKHTKKLESNSYAGTLPWKVFIASQGH